MTFILKLALVSMLVPLLCGCGGNKNQKQNKDFYTSGNREADERADQPCAG